MDKITGPNSGKMLLGEYVVSLSEIEKKRFRIEKMLKDREIKKKQQKK